jgi:hypothetical protein
MDSRYLIEALNIPDDIPDENKNGNCYQAALHKFMEDPQRYTLVHGVVTGQGPIAGMQYGHAWVEDGNAVIDMTLPKHLQSLPKDLYYAMGHIDITRRYNAHQVLKMLDRYGTYGPWDSVFDDYY